MAIEFTCRCQARIKVKDEYAGRRVKCPKCGEALTVPRQEPIPTAKAIRLPVAACVVAPEQAYPVAPEPPPVTRANVCPSCNADLPAQAVMCIQCGYHLLQKKHLTAVRDADDTVPEPAVGRAACPSCNCYKSPRDQICVWCGFQVTLKTHLPLKEIARSTGVKDLASARARVRKQRHSKTCPLCGSATELAGGVCSTCEATERKLEAAQRELREEQQRELALGAPYREYRQATVARLTRMWQEILATPKEDAAKLRATLARWPREFLTCEPPKELLTLEGLSAENLESLKLLAEGAKHLSEVTAADLLPEAWPSCQKKAAQRAADRVAILCRLAKGLGKDRHEANRVTVWLVTPAGEGYDGGATESIRQQFGEALATRAKHYEVVHVDQPPTNSTTHGRRCLTVLIQRWLLQTKQWSDGSITATTKVCYVDDEPEPGEQVKFEKTLAYERQFSSFTSADDLAQAWAKSVLGSLPASFHATEGTWAGIDITCPRCGHLNLITDRYATRSHPCTRCGDDAITGQSADLQKKAKQVGKAAPGGFSLLFSSKARDKQREVQAALAAEQAASTASLKYPDKAAENERKIKAKAAARK